MNSATRAKVLQCYPLGPNYDHLAVVWWEHGPGIVGVVPTVWCNTQRFLLADVTLQLRRYFVLSGRLSAAPPSLPPAPAPMHRSVSIVTV